MKKGIIAMAVILMMTMVGCGKDEHSQYSKIYERYGNIENYSADISVKVISKDGESVYKAKQYYAEPDLYKIEYTSSDMKGISCVLEGESLKFRDKDGNITKFQGYVPNEKYYIFITDFMERYCKSEAAKSSQRNGKTILEVQGEGNDPMNAKMELWVNSKTGNPVKLITYNQKNEPRVIVEYDSFKINTKIDKKIFDL